MTDNSVFDRVREEIALICAEYKFRGRVFLGFSLGCLIAIHNATYASHALVVAVSMPGGPASILRQVSKLAVKALHARFKGGVASVRGFVEAQLFFGTDTVDARSAGIMDGINAEIDRHRYPRLVDWTLLARYLILARRKSGPFDPDIVILQGRLDPLIGPNDRSDVLRRCPNATVAPVEGSHVLPLTNPGDVAASVRDFLADRHTGDAR
jgi:pimeloyl-ACP methyl ester carboxylesterase